MKFAIIFSVLIVLARASLFGEFLSVMSSMKNGLQKLITDVVTDVKDTFDCTVIAFETALSVNTFRIPNGKCNGVATERRDMLKRYPSEENNKELPPTLADMSVGNKLGNLNFKRDIFKQIDALSDKNEKNLPNVKFKFTFDTESLQNVNIFLKKELEKMSLNIREFGIMEFDQESELNSVLKYLNVLRNAQGNGRNDSELNKVRQILDGTSKILKLNVNNRDTNEDKFKKIIKILNTSSNQDKDIKENSPKLPDNRSPSNNSHSNSNSSSYESPTTFKTILNVLDNAVEKTSKSSNDNTQTTYEQIKEMEDSISNARNVDNSDYELFFGDKSNNGESRKDTLDEATKLIEESRRTNSILNNFFAKADKSGSDVFDDPQLF